MFPSTPAWYVATVRPRHEKAASSWMQRKGIDVLNAVYCERRRWSDRVKEVEVPLFPGYVFCRISGRQKMAVLNTPAVTSIVSAGAQPAIVPDEEIAAVQLILASGRKAMPWLYPGIGQRVLVNSGCFAGLAGTVVREKNEYRVVVDIELLQRSVAVEIDSHDLLAEAVGAAPKISIACSPCTRV